MDAKLLIEQGDIVGVLKAKYFAIKEAIGDAEERHTKAVDGLAEPKAKAAIALHELELLKARIEKTKESIKEKKEALSEVKEDLGEANEEIQENKGWRAQFKEREIARVKELEELEDKCKEAKEHLFETNRKFSEATRSLAMREFDIEAATNRRNAALEDIKEHEDMRQQSAQQMIHVEKRGGKAAERKLEKEQQIEAMTNQIETIDDQTEDALRSISKSELKREYILDEINYWQQKTKKLNEEVDRMNQEDWVSY